MKNPEKDYKTNSKTGQAQFLLWCCDFVPEIYVKKEVRNEYFDLYKYYLQLGHDENDAKKDDEDEAVMDYNDYMNLIKNTYGANSKEFLVVSLYFEVPARDNFYLYIIEREAQSTNMKRNYLVNPHTGNCVVILNVYKTVNLYETYRRQLSIGLSKMIRGYMVAKKLTYDNHLFPGKLNKFITAMNLKVGVAGGVNLIRYMISSTDIATFKDISLKEKMRLSKNAMHSYLTHQAYGRKLKKLIIIEPQNNNL